MTVKIEEKIVKAEVVKSEKDKPDAPAALEIQPYQRPAKLHGTTYKIKPSVSDAALYLTINDMELPDGRRRPFEIFINTKDKKHDQFITAMTRLISAIFRMPVPFDFVIDELKQVAAADGSYFLTKGDPAGKGRVKGIVEHIGRVIEAHCKERGLVKGEEEPKAPTEPAAAPSGRQEGQECDKCGERAVFVIDGCATCRSCGDSKCG